VNAKDKIDLTTMEIVLLVVAVLLLLCHILSFSIFIYWNVSESLALLCLRPIGKGAKSDDARLTSVCLSRTSGLSREQRGL